MTAAGRLRPWGFILTMALCVSPLVVRADGDKQLESLKGSVSYETGTAKRQLAHAATIVLADKAYAIPGTESLGALTLADSSRVTMGSDTRVQIAFFNQVHGSNAKFIVYQGKTRFKIEHPQGRAANYTFQTPTAQIAVRGTEGDIGVDGRDLVVNVYGLSDQNLPVVVTTEDGKNYALHAGQHLAAKWAEGQIQTQVEALTDDAVAQFEEIGAPVSDWASAAQNLSDAALGAATSNLPFGLPGISIGAHPGAKPQATPQPSPTPNPSATP
ncbi:MAG: hypothetical protein NVS1B14_02780 [Vulcanimicrobiaceae bacterium]